ncbi:MAG: hypothetical protein M3083_08825 [Actinomycetota bacterium]|nr:hypothetical protein [Actinomycetota bacterium]
MVPVAVLVAVAVVAGCRGSHATLSVADVSQRYQSAMDPANRALSDMVNRALAYNGGSPAQLDSAASPTAGSLNKAAGQVSGISAPALVRRDIQDVASALHVLVGDLNTLGAARGSDVQPEIARLVADAGREAAADNLVRVALSESANPPAIPAPQPAAVEVPTTVADTTTEATTTTTTLRHTTATTRSRTTTTIAHTATTR